MEFDDDDLLWALGIWKDPFREDPETVLKAASIVRYWRVELKAKLRGVSRTSEEYRRIKVNEERLEGAVIDLHSAWITQLSARKHGG